jgi:hypothetical protein
MFRMAGFLAQVRNPPVAGDAVELTLGDLILLREVIHCCADREKWPGRRALRIA